MKVLKRHRKSTCMIGCIIIFVVGYILGLINPYERIQERVEYYKYKDEIISVYKKSIEVNREKSLQSGSEKKYVEEFNPLIHTFRFKNFASEDNKGGTCEGISFYELMNFNGKKEDLSKYELSEGDSSKLYEDKSQYTIFKDDSKDGEDNIINYENIVKLALGLKDVSDDDPEVYYTENTKLDNENTAKVIKELVNLQTNKDKNVNHTRYSSETYFPHYASALSEYVEESSISNKRSINPILLKEKVDNDELVLIGVLNRRLGGHALLVYGYEILDENNIKFYVCDSNYPIKPGLEKEYTENISILFTKDVDEKNWGYIYSPIIESHEIITCYNSFIPGTVLYIYYEN
ncbi:hypothetical protein ABHA01_01960 [Clostridium paraputrificum]|uniref:hypothetical protein n=1 Tax=Clostridium paraputrificum TaxID=29363 RepID=UPI00325B68B6